MSETDPTPEESFAWAQEKIAKAKAANDAFLDLNEPEGRALERLPDEIGDLTQLELLNLASTQVSDLGALSGLSGLQGLYLSNTQVSDLRALAGLSGLQRLSLDNTQVSDLGALSGLSGLQTLSLNNTQVSDLRALAGLSVLQRLTLSNTQVSDLGALAGLSGLQRLTLTKTRVSDLLPLAGLSKLGGEGAVARLPAGLSFAGTPAAERDDAHRALVAIEGREECARQVLQYLNGEHPELGGPPEPFGRPPPAPQKPLEQQRGGVRFQSQDNYLEPFAEGEIGSRAAVMQPSVIEALEAMAKPMQGSNEFPEPTKWAEEALSLVRRDLEDVNAVGYRLWVLSQKFASRQENDDVARHDSKGMSPTMSPDMREGVDGVIATLPMFLRQLPECRALDTEFSDWQRDPATEASAKQVFVDARSLQIIQNEVGVVLETWMPAEEGKQADRQAKVGVTTARNLIVAGLTLVVAAGAVAGTAVVDELVRSAMKGTGVPRTIEEKTVELLGTRSDPIDDVMKGAPADQQATVRSYLKQIRDAWERATSSQP